MNFFFFALFAVVFAGQSLNVYLFQGGPHSIKRYLASKGDNVVPRKYNGNVKLVLNSDTTLVDTVSRKYFHIGSDGFVTLSKQPQKGYSVESNLLVYSEDVLFGELDGRLAFDWKSSFSESQSFAVRIHSTQPVPDVKP